MPIYSHVDPALRTDAEAAAVDFSLKTTESKVNGSLDGHEGHKSVSSDRADDNSRILLEEGPLPIVWRGQKAYEEARVGRVFNKRRPARYPVAVLKARNQSDSGLHYLCFVMGLYLTMKIP